MVLYRRNFVAGGTFFFTATLADRRSSVLVEDIALLRRAFRVTRREHPFAIDAVVVLPDHLHIIMTLPYDDADFPGRWKRIKSLFTRYVVAQGLDYERNRRGEYALWQRRFWEHTIRDEKDLARHVDYIHCNPVKHGLVAQVCDWPHSSFHRYVKLGVVPKDWGWGWCIQFAIRRADRLIPDCASLHPGYHSTAKHPSSVHSHLPTCCRSSWK